MRNTQFLILFLYCLQLIIAKYIEGTLKTYENWAFLTRFCFLSEEGEFEYFLEFNENQGTPNLLFYYDTKDQWPSVYKSEKTCYEKEAVLHSEQKQIVNLTANHPYFRELSRCTYYNKPSTLVPKFTVATKPTTKTRKSSTKATSLETTTLFETTTEINDFTTNYEETSINPKNEFELLESETTDFSTTTETYYTSEKMSPIKKRSLVQTKKTKAGGNRTVFCHNIMRFRSSRERWWFIALSNCNGSKGINVKYNILMTNGPIGDYWHEHFSADEFYILPILLAFSIAYSLIFLAVIICSIELKSRQLLHTTYKIFVFSTLFQLFGIIISSAAYLKYAMHGVGPSRIHRFGDMLMGTSETFFLLLLLLLAKGFTITRGRLPLKASVKLTIFMCLYIITYISIFIYEANVFDPGEVLYLYESPAGYSLMALRIFAWFMFIYSTIFTLKRYPEKANFYYPFNICGTLWFIAGPAFILSANSYIDKWVRESVVCAVLQFITFGGHLTFLILTMPSLANKNFPYHVRTTQIGVMELTHNYGVTTIEQFAHHTYEPNETIDQTIVPLTRRTEQIFEGMYAHDMQPTLRTHTENRMVEEESNGFEHVLDWSLAKKPSVNQLPVKNNIEENDETVDRSGKKNVNANGRNGTFDDYVREVPFELFTISRMTTDTK